MAPGRTRRSCTLGLTGRRELWVSSPKGAWCHWCIAQHTKGALQSTNGAAEGPLHRHESGKTSSAGQAQRKSFELKHFLLLLFQLLFACDEVFYSKKKRAKNFDGSGMNSKHEQKANISEGAKVQRIRTPRQAATLGSSLQWKRDKRRYNNVIYGMGVVNNIVIVKNSGVGNRSRGSCP